MRGLSRPHLRPHALNTCTTAARVIYHSRRPRATSRSSCAERITLRDTASRLCSLTDADTHYPTTGHERTKREGRHMFVSLKVNYHIVDPLCDYFHATFDFTFRPRFHSNRIPKVSFVTSFQFSPRVRHSSCFFSSTKTLDGDTFPNDPRDRSNTKAVLHCLGETIKSNKTHSWAWLED